MDDRYKAVLEGAHRRRAASRSQYQLQRYLLAVVLGASTFCLHVGRLVDTGGGVEEQTTTDSSSSPVQETVPIFSVPNSE